MTTLTVLLLCWNHSAYLEPCIKALADQTDQSFDVIFLDNCSKDGSFDLALTLFEKHCITAKMLRNVSPVGVAANLQRLFSEAETDLVCPLSTDDWYQPTYIAKVKEISNQYPEVGWIYPSILEYSELNGNFNEKDDSSYQSGDVTSNIKQLKWDLGFVGICYRREALKKIGGWDSHMVVEDNDLLYRLSLGHTCFHLKERLVVYRASENSMTQNLIIMSDGVNLFFKKHWKDFPNANRHQVSYNRSYALRAWARGDRIVALQLWLRTLRHGVLVLRDKKFGLKRIPFSLDHNRTN